MLDGIRQRGRLLLAPLLKLHVRLLWRREVALASISKDSSEVLAPIALHSGRRHHLAPTRAIQRAPPMAHPLLEVGGCHTELLRKMLTGGRIIHSLPGTGDLCQVIRSGGKLDAGPSRAIFAKQA